MSDIHAYAPLWGSWHVESLIGEGSFGKVYKVRKEEFGKTYYSAVKIISIPQNEADLRHMRNEGLDEVSVKSYFQAFVSDILQEIDLMSQLRGNSNIVSFEDHKVIECTNGFGWDILIRMELLQSLSEKCMEQPMDEAEVIKLGIHICRALELCARTKTIHRDIKPDNIFVSAYGDYKLGDFGIARQIERTMTGLSKKGTYTYMAPEVFKGDEYGASVDFYSLGIVMYRLLNKNRTPFLPAFPAPIMPTDRDTSLQRRMKGEALPAIPGVSDALNAIILKACAFDRKERFASATEMREALETYAAEKPAVVTAPVIVPATVPEPESVDEKTEVTVGAFDALPQEKTEVTVGVFEGESREEQFETTLETLGEPFPANPSGKKRRQLHVGVVAILFVLFGCLFFNSSYHYNRGKANLQAGNYERARINFSWVINNNSNRNYYRRNDAYGYRGECNLKLRRYENAIADYHEAFAMMNGQYSHLAGLGNCYYELERYDEATEYYFAALAFCYEDNELPFYQNLCLQAYRKAGGTKDAEYDYYSPVLKDFQYLDQDLVWRMYDRYGSYLYNGRYFDKAIQVFTKYIQEGPEDNWRKAEVYTKRASCYIFLDNDYVSALSDCNTAIDIADWDRSIGGSDQSYAIGVRALSYYHLGQYENVLSDLEYYLEWNSQSTWGRTLKAYALRELGREYSQADISLAYQASSGEPFGYFGIVYGKTADDLINIQKQQ